MPPKRRREPAPTRCSRVGTLIKSFAEALPVAQRASLGLPSSVPPAPRRPAAVLPLDEVRRGLEAHPMVSVFRLNIKHVHSCLVELAATPEEPKAPVEPKAPEEPPAVESVALDEPPDEWWWVEEARKADGGRADEQAWRCCGTVAATPDRSCHACTGCGRVFGAYISYEAPHRYFAEDRYAGKHDPNHWVWVAGEGGEAGADPWPEVEVLRPFAFVYGAVDAHAAEVRRRLARAYCAGRRVHDRMAAAAAALLLVENPDMLTDRRVGAAPAPPEAPYKCARCVQGFHVQRELRHHEARCRPWAGAKGGPAKAQARAQAKAQAKAQALASGPVPLRRACTVGWR